MLKNVLRLCAVVGVLSVALSDPDELLKSPPYWAVNLLQDKVSVSSLAIIEPGFDLSEDEIFKFKLWRHGIAPYYIDTTSFDKVLRDRIRTYLEAASGLIGLQFMELPSPPQDPTTRWIFFINRRGQLDCADHSIKDFTNEGVQKIVLGYDCIISSGGLAELVLLLAGVEPQHNSPNRDNYINVKMDKIILEKKHLYEKLKDTDWLFHELVYDFNSAGHYHFHENTIDGSATIVSRKPVEPLVGERDGFSYLDVLKVRMLYNYISKRPYAHAKGSDCKKIFKPGSKLSQYDTSKTDDVKPRQKPDLYLGTTTYNNNDNVVENNDDNIHVGNSNDVDKDEINKDNDESANTDQDNNDADNIKNADSDGQSKYDTEDIGRNNEGLKYKQNEDPLLILSDYETDDGKKKKRKSKKRVRV